MKLQHLPEYIYTEQCSRDKVWASIDEVARKEKEEHKERERLDTEERNALELERQAMQPYVAKAEKLMPAIEKEMSTLIIDQLKLIHEETGHERFVVGGSWASEKICQVVSKVCKNDASVDPLAMPANDLDLYWGGFTDDDTKTLFVDLTKVEYSTVEGLVIGVASDLDKNYLNTVKCSNLSPHSLLANNDLNITATCLDVDFSRDNQPFKIYASDCFWSFLFQKGEEREIRTVNTFNVDCYEATTCVRLAYKAFDLGLKYSLGKLDPTVGTIALSNKVKFDKIKDWHGSPFHEYQCNKRGTCFAIVKKHKKQTCFVEDCSGWANKNCSYGMCKKCCVNHTSTSEPKVKPCKVKDHVTKS